MKHIFILFFFLVFNTPVLPEANSPMDDGPIERLTEILTEIAGYDYNSRSWLVDLRDVMKEIYTSRKYKEEAEKKMIAFLQSDASVAGKQAICQELEGLATENSIPVLMDMVDQRQTAEMALNALEMIPDPSVDKELRKALKQAEDWQKPGIIQTIGKRGDEKAIKQLEDHAHHPDPLIQRSAIDALGKTGGSKAAKIVGKLYVAAEPPQKWETAESYLKIADNLNSSGEPVMANKIYRQIYEDIPPVGLLIAALQGILQDPLADAEILFMNILNSEDVEQITAVIPVIRDYPAPLNYTSFAELFPGLSPENQIALMIAFAEREDEAIRPVALAAVSADADRIRIGGLQSLQYLGNPEDVFIFAETAASSRGEVKEFARKCLYEMKGQETDRVILDAIPESGLQSTSGPAVRLELIRSVAERNIVEGIPVLVELTSDQDKNIRLEAIRAIGVIGSPEILETLISRIGNAGGRAERNEMIKTIVLLAGKKTNPEDQSDEVLAAMPEISDDETLIAMIEILGNLGNEKALPVLRVLISHENREIQYAAIRALSQWPNDDPVMDLKEIAENSKDLKKHTLALQGYVKLLSQSTTLSPDMKVSAFQKAFNEARNPDEKKLILSAVGTSGSVKGLEMVTGLLKDSGLQAEAEATFISLLENIADQYRDQKLQWMEEAARISTDQEFKNTIRKIMEGNK
jgi:HEAT repeat protein